VGDPPADDPYEGAVPPGYDWPTHGGYLGCLVGSIAGCLLTAFVSANLFSFLWAARIVSGPIYILLTLVALVLIMWALGRLGWVLGKRFYRAYEQPMRSVWGEDDDEAPVAEGSVVEGGIVTLTPEGGEPATN
jgi:hypothetical protein